MNKVMKIEENDLGIDIFKLMGTLILKKANPIVSVPFVANNESETIKNELYKRGNIEVKEEGLYFNGQLITKEMQMSLLVNDLCELAKKDSHDDLYFCNMIKNILNKDVLSKCTSETSLTVDDLMKSLYGIERESKSL